MPGIGTRPVTALSVGERVRLYRVRRGLSRERLAQLSGVSESWLKQVERGTRKADSLRMLIPVAEALRLQLWDLIPGPRRLAPDGSSLSDAFAAVERALLPRVFGTRNGEARELSWLRAELDRTWTLRDSGRFGETAARLTVLIPSSEASAHEHVHRAGDTEALTLYAEVHWLTAYALFRAGERGELSRIAADRFAQAARRIGDPLLMAASARCLAHVLLHCGQAEAARSVVGDALDALQPGVGTGDAAYQSVWGALLLAGALAEARLGDRATSRRMLREAEEPARRVGDVDEYHMTFGPTNLLIHAASCALELGDFGEVVRVGRQIDVSGMPGHLVVRRAQVHLDLALAYELQRQDEAAVLRLHEAERTAPQFVRSSAAAREMVRAILRRPVGRSVPGLIDLAGRVGALTD
jgi:transcriptional regulator with XRE-family HTH domain